MALVSLFMGMEELDSDPEPLEPAYNYAPGTFWVEMVGVTNGAADLILHGTVPDQPYEILTKTALSDAVWVSETNLFGAGEQDWTQAFVPVGDRTNSLFFLAKFWGDADGNGVPDYWEIAHWGATGTDPYGDDDGDGWLNLQEYQNGTDPRFPDLSPPPRNVRFSVDGTGTNITVCWESGGGPVAYYSIEDYPGIPYAQTTGPDTLCLTYFVEPVFGTVWNLGAAVRAHFSNGTSRASSWVTALQPRLTVTAKLVPGENSLPCLVVSALPPDTTTLRLSVYDYVLNTWPAVELDVSRVIDGKAVLSPQEVEELAWYSWIWCSLQVRTSTGEYGEAVDVGCTSPLSWVSDDPYTFIDCSEHLRHNLQFLLRSATRTQPFKFSIYDNYPETPWERWRYRYPASSDYEHYGFQVPGEPFPTLDELRPVWDNHLWFNFVHDISLFDENYFVSGAFCDEPYERRLFYPLVFLDIQAALPPSLPVLLSGANESWYYTPWNGYPEVAWEVGLEPVDAYNYALSSGVTNYFGLPLLSMRFETNRIALPGNIVSNSTAFSCCEAPQFRTDGHFFASQSLEDVTPAPVIPGCPEFTPTQAPVPMIASFGKSSLISAWAKKAIVNGDLQKPVYLQQYFDKAYKVDSSGNVTSQETGVLSPYGEFFPTEPGPAAVVTRPDLETGERGTGIVHAVKLQLDVDHNGEMDLSFAGPDNTSENHPYVFWINNDFDRAHTVDLTDYEQDDLASNDSKADCPFTPGRPTLDSEYRDVNGSRIIPSERDLEDFTRLWICGVTTNLLSALPPGSTVTLSWGDVGSPNLANPTINLFQAFEAAGGTGYLTNITTARLGVK